MAQTAISHPSRARARAGAGWASINSLSGLPKPKARQGAPYRHRRPRHAVVIRRYCLRHGRRPVAGGVNLVGTRNPDFATRQMTPAYPARSSSVPLCALAKSASKQTALTDVDGLPKLTVVDMEAMGRPRDIGDAPRRGVPRKLAGYQAHCARWNGFENFAATATSARVGRQTRPWRPAIWPKNRQTELPPGWQSRIANRCFLRLQELG